ncbi:tail fiber assembly protein [Serratia marcescens]|uniref:tail fiber assembly protein n=1 Tax=Serratia marcescens TaxID=615 RepID=UPI00299F8EFD|nr:tail fiber assembly protein [Serratia marcescens]
MPDWAITAEPPAAEQGCVLLFTEGQWQQIEDKTGQVFYDSNGEKHTVPNAYYTLPEGCTFVAPPEAKSTFVTQWNGSEWDYVKDLRGQIAYSTETKEPISITEIGPLPEGYTLLTPARFEQWDGKRWVKDEFAERVFYTEQADRQKSKLLSAATEQIAVLNYAIEKGTATDSEKAKLAHWEEYRLELNRIDTSATNIIWPEKP